ncbi:MAG: undecaprenyl-diphosphate phosphatase [Acidobacteriia bacterium]|nr:undecaprenyl-diphosphate phosphatase [Terriglobia bacterium]
MNPYLLSVLLGIVEGLTEFLPVSSTAHLRIVERAMGLDLASGYWKMYSIVIQLGAILCVPIYFRARLTEFFTTFPGGPDGRHNLWNHPVTLTGVAFVVTAGPSYLLAKTIGKNLESLYVMATSLIVGGIVMWIVDAMYGVPRVVSANSPTVRSVGAATAGYPTETVYQMTLPQSIWIGACQILSAVFPGVSRSMSSIAAGQVAGLSRPAALEFSFLVSIPTMFMATGYSFYDSLRHKPGAGGKIGVAPRNAEEWAVLAIGFVVSFVVAYLVVAWFMRWVRQRGFVPFAVYRILVGAAVLAWVLKSGV